MDCTVDSPDDCGFPRDGAIEFRFDRYLRPDTAVRQSMRLELASLTQSAGLFLEPEYDVVERVVRFRTGGILQPGVAYRVDLRDPEQHELGFGFRAIDGAPLEERGSLPLSFSFRTARTLGAPVAPEEPVPDCSQVLEVFSSAAGGCTTASCHGPGRPLDLSSAAALRRTFLRPARETELTDRPGRPLVNPRRFGVSLPLITPGEASQSYLLYKLLANADNFAGLDCSSRFQVSFADECLFSPAEAARLGDWFLLGTSMPPPGFDAPAFGLSELRLIQRWISAGAPLEGCL